MIRKLALVTMSVALPVALLASVGRWDRLRNSATRAISRGYLYR